MLGAVADGPAGEGAVLPCDPGCLGERSEKLATELPVNREVVLTAEHVVVDACYVRDARIEPRVRSGISVVGHWLSLSARPARAKRPRKTRLLPTACRLLCGPAACRGQATGEMGGSGGEPAPRRKDGPMRTAPAGLAATTLAAGVAQFCGL